MKRAGSEGMKEANDRIYRKRRTGVLRRVWKEDSR
jgi:hypothetical protein